MSTDAPAVTAVERDGVAVLVAHDLHLDVARLRAELHHKHGGARHLIGDLHEIGLELLVVVGHADTLPTAACMCGKFGFGVWVGVGAGMTMYADIIHIHPTYQPAIQPIYRSHAPSEALSMTGYPMRFAAANASASVRTMAFWKVSSGMVPSSVSSAVRPSPGWVG